MDLNNNIQTKITLDNNLSNERGLPHKHAFIFNAYDADFSPISERVLQRAANKMHMISQEDLTSSFELLFQQK
jgi:hypothetical protein